MSSFKSGSTTDDDVRNALRYNIEINDAFDLYNTFLNYAFKRKGSIKNLNMEQINKSKALFDINE